MFIKIKNEKVYQHFMSDKILPTEEGRSQFFNEQSEGIKPLEPDAYYRSLSRGKTSFDFLVSEYRKMWEMGEWWGFLLLWRDWSGNRWILPYLCSWYPSLRGRPLPEWLGKETKGEVNENT